MSRVIPKSSSLVFHIFTRLQDGYLLNGGGSDVERLPTLVGRVNSAGANFPGINDKTAPE
jgi:hypothetical protein